MKKVILDVLKTIIESLLVVWLIMTFVAIPVNVVGQSMYPTLHEGDFGFGAVFTKWSEPKRFDIVILENENTKEKIVKRIVGLPNETVEYHDNKLYINGEYIEEPFVVDNYTDDMKIVLGDDDYFCLGDNRSRSKDSRYYGPFSKKDIVARKIFVAFPFDNLGLK